MITSCAGDVLRSTAFDNSERLPAITRSPLRAHSSRIHRHLTNQMRARI